MRIFSILFLLLLLAIAGCVRLEREAPLRDFYGLESNRTEAPAESPHFGAVRVYRFDPVARFGGDRFVYRYEGLRYEDDYYNRFIAPPGALIAEEVRRWLDHSGLFAEVLSGPARIEPDYMLEGRIVELYGDFRSAGAAVLSLEITLIHDAAARSETLLRRVYRSAHPLAEPSAGALATAWSKALEEILHSFEDDLLQLTQDR